MDPTTVGTLLLNDSLPPELQIRGKAIDKKELMSILRHIAEKYPDRYKDVIKTMNDVGRDAAFTEGVSVSLSGLRKTDKEKKLIQRARSRVMAIETSDLDPDAKKQAITDVMFPMVEKMQKALEESGESENNPYWFQVKSGARGKMSDYNAIRGASGLVNDHRNEIVPIPILHSLSEGLDPVEYWAGTYGQRKGMLEVKLATADAGFLSKKLANAAHRIVVNKDTAPMTRLPVGLPSKVSDTDNIGAVLARDAGAHKAGERITPDILESLSEDGVEDILVHSPMTEPTEDGGISRIAAGRRDRTELSNIGDAIGIAAAQSIGAPLSQGSLNCLSKGTLVRMADFSLRQIETIKPGEFVLGADISGKTFPVEVTHTFDNGVQPCVTYRFRQSCSHHTFHTITCTPAHKVLTHIHYSSEYGEMHRDAVCAIGDMSKASGIRCEGGLSSENHLIYDWRAKLLGVLLGDGCYTESVTGIHLSCADQTQIDHLNGYLAPHDLQFHICGGQTIYYALTRLSQRSYGRIVRDTITGRVMRTVTENPILQWFRDEGLYGKYAHEKEIPSFVNQWDNQAVSELLAGLFVTDGSVFSRKKDGMGFSFASSSEKLIDGVMELLRIRFGIYATKSSSNSKKKRRHYNVCITKYRDVIRFYRSIRLFGVKCERAADRIKTAVESVTREEWWRQEDRTDAGHLHVYDIEVAHPDHLFVLGNGMIVSNSKHQSGAIGAKKNLRTGFEYLNRVIESPETFPESGPLAEVDGVVKGIRKAPQGGQFVTVDDRDYYLHPGVEPVVKPGDALEAGDDISDGAPHPEQLVRLKGVGEARRRYAEMLQEALTNSGIKTHRRNIETVVAGLINWVKVTNPNGVGDHIVDDVASYNSVAGAYKARAGTKRVAPNSGVGKYLEEPVLHYTPGTRITKKVAGDLQKWGVKDVDAHDDEPDFQPVMQRGVLGVYNDNDWQTRLSGFYTSSGFLDSVHRSRVSDPNSTSYVPALAKATGFGDTLKTTGSYGTPPLPTSPPRSPR
jgi:DNA-directed RNA polymerase beta' subunit